MSLEPPYEESDGQKRAQEKLRKAEDAVWREAVRDEDSHWKASVNEKLDRLCAFEETYGDYLRLCLKREQDREKIRQAVLEKVLSGAVWAGLGLMVLALWQLLKERIK